jgi:hypothetical protein
MLVFLFFAVLTLPLFGQSREDLTRELREVIGGSGRDRIARAESLLAAGADPNGTYKPEVTFLTQALSQNSVRLVRLLLDYGAVPVFLSGDRFDVTDDRGR